MPDATDRRFLVKITVVTAVLVVVAVVVAFGWRPLLIAYHRRALEGAVADGAHPGVGQLDGPTLRFHHHVEALVKLGYLQRRAFATQHIDYFDRVFEFREMELFEILLQTHVPGAIYSVEHSQRGMEIVARSEVMATVQEFILEHDVPHFMARFGLEAIEAEQNFGRKR